MIVDLRVQTPEPSREQNCFKKILFVLKGFFLFIYIKYKVS
jgi:hypothetical protein